MIAIAIEIMVVIDCADDKMTAATTTPTAATAKTTTTTAIIKQQLSSAEVAQRHSPADRMEPARIIYVTPTMVRKT